jgi:hypothetical protein
MSLISRLLGRRSEESVSARSWLEASAPHFQRLEDRTVELGEALDDWAWERVGTDALDTSWMIAGQAVADARAAAQTIPSGLDDADAARLLAKYRRALDGFDDAWALWRSRDDGIADAWSSTVAAFDAATDDAARLRNKLRRYVSTIRDQCGFACRRGTQPITTSLKKTDARISTYGSSCRFARTRSARRRPMSCSAFWIAVLYGSRAFERAC